MPIRPQKMVRRLDDVSNSAAWFLALGTAYLLCVASDAAIELCYAATFGLAGTILISALQRADRRRFTLSPGGLLVLLRRAVVGAVAESWLLLGPRLWAQLHGQAAAGRYIRIAFERSQGDPKGDGRVAGALWVQAFTPNTIPLFIDRGDIVLHQLIRRREPNAGDPGFPA